MNAEHQNDLVRLATAGNSVLAHIWQQSLQEKGIHCQVLGDTWTPASATSRV